VRYAWIEAHIDTYAIGMMCALLVVSRSGFHDAHGRAPLARALEKERKFKRTKGSISDRLVEVNRQIPAATALAERWPWPVGGDGANRLAATGQTGGGRHQPSPDGPRRLVLPGQLPGDALVEFVGRWRRC